MSSHESKDLSAGTPAPSTNLTGDALLARIRRNTAPEARYEVRGEIARGGMGAILEVWEGDLRRTLAMKVIRARAEPGDEAQLLARFLEEAQITAQLTHPGVIPVHVLGVDGEGRAFFTMPLVRGHDLDHVFGLVRRAEEGWSQTRALAVLLKACETMAYAHSRGVIHRDLKPANVMTGAFGEVYVMDWGVAKIAGRADRAQRAEDAPRAQDEQPDAHARSKAPASERVSSERGELDAGSDLHTLEGAIVGTPSFMSPEQAAGSELDARSDVYAMGAILYTLLAGRAPYTAPHVRTPPIEILRQIQAGPPRALAQIATDVAPELLSICEKAMARDPAARYPDMQAMAEDLRAFLEGRVVRAHRTGAWIEFRKWVARNRGMAGALAALIVAMLLGTGGVAWTQKLKGDLEKDRNARILGLSDTKVARDLRDQEGELWPAVPDKSQALVTWVRDAQELEGRIGYHRETRNLVAAAHESAQNEAWLLEQLDLLIKDLESFPELTLKVAARRDVALSLEERTVTGADARSRWAAAIEDIAQIPAYSGLRIRPQLGLLPLERDPQSGLWEFWSVATGEEPVREPETRRWNILPETGLVFVLLPASRTAVGSKPLTVIDPETGDRPTAWARFFELAPGSSDWGQPYHDPGRDSREPEQFFEDVDLAPLFASKYEVTQAQWLRVCDENPSQHHDSASLGGPTHPMETLSWFDAVKGAERLGASLPTEAQWEFMCRAGSTSPFSSGLEYVTLQDHANIADATFQRGGNLSEGSHTPEVDDGYACHAPVGRFEPNPFGLHDVHGNVWEWCLDRLVTTVPPRARDGLRDDGGTGLEGTIRGGSWNTGARSCRCANRYNFDRNNTDGDVGFRPVRILED